MLTIRQDQMDQLSAATGQPAVTPCRTWVEVRLLDYAHKPVPGVAYRIQLPDGSIQEGELDDGGSVRFDGILNGRCDVTFPELDPDSWTFETSDSGDSD